MDGGEIRVQPPGRLPLLDSIRGLTLLQMVAYHGLWDLVFLFGMDWPWFSGQLPFLWQQEICWTFILLAGFCWPYGRRRARRGVTVLAAGVVVTIATVAATPQQVIYFGVLTLLGSAMLLTIPAEGLLRRVPAPAGLAACGTLFALAYRINRGWLGLGPWQVALPPALYRGWVSTYLGFPMEGFYSPDYFSLLPWLLLFWCGYYLNCLLACRPGFLKLAAHGAPPLAFLGRHSLLIYLVHQPVLYGLCGLLAP